MTDDTLQFINASPEVKQQMVFDSFRHITHQVKTIALDLKVLNARIKHIADNDIDFDLSQLTEKITQFCLHGDSLTEQFVINNEVITALVESLTKE